MRGASFHLKPVLDPEGCVAHNTRTWSEDHPQPTYLIGGDYGAVIKAGDVVQVHADKMAMATGQAKAIRRYSPVWEGVLNLDETQSAATLVDQVGAFAEGYQRLTGHRVLQAHIHLDEGRIEDGRKKINAHAHIVVDRTNARGRPIRIDRVRLRQVQDLAAKTTGLARGDDARTTRRRHLSHQTYRALAQKGLLQNQTQVEEQARAVKQDRDAAEVKAIKRGHLGMAVGILDLLNNGQIPENDNTRIVTALNDPDPAAIETLATDIRQRGLEQMAELRSSRPRQTKHSGKKDRGWDR